MIIKPKSIKINYILNLTRLLLNVIVLIFTMPYVSRVLSPASIGRVDYAYSIIEFFIIFSALGIPLYGVRQIAKIRDNIKERSKVVVELFIILLITTTIAFTVLVIMINTVFTADYKNMLLLLSTGILLSNMGFEWFYQGIENQLLITIRNLFVKTTAVVLLFFLVKSEADVYYYALFIILSTFGGSIFNIIYIKNFILINREILKGLNLKRHLKPALTILMASVSVSIYMLLDKTMLGIMVSDEAVGYYTQATKLPRLMLVLVTTVGAVMLPRLSHLLANDKKEEYRAYMDKSLKYILLVAVPGTILFIVLAKEIILVMAGDEFIPSIKTMQLISPIIFIVAIAYYVGFQVLYPLGKEYIYTIAVSVAGVVNFVFNYFTLPYLKQDGAALGTLLAEITGAVIMTVAARKYLRQTGFFKPDKLKYPIAGIVMAFALYLCTFFNLPVLLNLFVASAVGLSVYGIVLLAMKETVIIEVMYTGLNFLKNNYGKK